MRRFVAGDLAGLFNGPSTVAFDPSLPMISLDLSPVTENSTHQRADDVLVARVTLDDSLTLLSNAADIYKTADNANRRLCDPALFKAIYIDEDSAIRFGYETPFGG